MDLAGVVLTELELAVFFESMGNELLDLGIGERSGLTFLCRDEYLHIQEIQTLNCVCL